MILPSLLAAQATSVASALALEVSMEALSAGVARRACSRKPPPISLRGHAVSSVGRPSRHCWYLAFKSCALGAASTGAGG
eukprot:9151175-Pyramimonas_sp.AAC.1